MTRTLIESLSKIWLAVAALRVWMYRTRILKQARLSAPVISIGNISFGGTGKTPTVIWLARRLAQRGLAVSILTRGYRRHSKGPQVFPQGGRSPASGATEPWHGDEVQLYLRHLPDTALGIAARRFEAGQMLEQQRKIDVHLLDDGFQHLSLARACDVVLIDATNPWGKVCSLPKALREPQSSLRRADIIILTRCEQVASGAVQSLQDTLGKLAPNALLLRSKTILTGYRASAEAPPVPRDSLAGKRAMAVAGVGNPESFFALLRDAKLEIVSTRSFPDHHRYNDQDVDQINDLLRASSAECLILTEKDVVNLPRPEHFSKNFIVPAYWAEIDIAGSSEQELLSYLERKIGRVSVSSERN